MEPTNNQNQPQTTSSQNAQTAATAEPPKKTASTKASDAWVTYDEIKAAVAHGNIDPFNTTAKAVQDILQVLFGKKGSPNSIYPALDKLKLEVAPKLPDAIESIPMPKEMQVANVAHWDSAVSLVRASYLHKVEKQRSELETLTLQKESLTRERTEQTERAESLSIELEETKEKSAADFEVINQTMEELTEKMLAMDKQIADLKEAHAKELHEAMEMLNAANIENNQIKLKSDQALEVQKERSDLVKKSLEDSIDRAGERDSQLRLQVKEANDRADAAIREANARADAAMKRADEYAKQMADLLSKAPGQN